MTIEYQRSIIKYVITDKKAKKVIKQLESPLFELEEHKYLISLVQEYYKEFKEQPSQINLIEYFGKKSKNVTDIVYNTIKNEILMIYALKMEDTKMVKKEIITYIQKKQIKELLAQNIEKINDKDDKVLDVLLKGFNKIKKIGQEDEYTHDSKPLFLLKDGLIGKKNTYKAIPCCFKGMNAMTAKGGFASPELIVLMGGPKSFKTGWMLVIAIGYVIDGYKVFIADFENGANNVLIRVQQAIAKCSYDDLMEGDLDPVILEQLKRIKKLKGELVIKNYQAHVSTMSDVETDLDELKEEGFEFTALFIDYADLAKSSNPEIKDKRLGIQDVYHHIIRLNNKFNTFTFTPSQVSKNAVNKYTISLTDFSEDFGKAMNAHAAFALCRTKEEQDAGVGRIIPVMQRMGKKYSSTTYVDVEIDEAIMHMQEIDLRQLIDESELTDK